MKPEGGLADQEDLPAVISELNRQVLGLKSALDRELGVLQRSVEEVGRKVESSDSAAKRATGSKGRTAPDEWDDGYPPSREMEA